MSTYKARKNEARRSSISTAKLLSTSALVAAGTLALMTGVAQADNWTDHTAVSGGSIDIDTSVANTTNITQNGHMVKVQGDGDINAGWTVNVAQPSSDAKYVLYDIENDPTYIMGALNANGEIYIFDQNGTIFGENSVVNVGSIITSTGFISDENILAGKLEFEGVAGDGAIRIESGANITVADAGLAAFVAPTVVNSGVISAKMGTVAFGAGEKVTLDLYGDGLYEIAVDGELADALLENKGNIEAEGGRVLLAAAAAKSAVDNIINVEGDISVGSATQEGGKIIISGGEHGTVAVSGGLDASGTNGGEISVDGENVHVTDTGSLSVDGGKGDDKTGDGGTTYIYGSQYAVLEGYLSGQGGENGGDGGDAELSAGDSVGFSGLVDLSAENGESGSFLIDPAHIFINDSYSFLGFGVGPIGTLTIYDQALANSLANNDVNLWATETINTGSDIDISEYDYDRYEQIGTTTLGPCPFCIVVPDYGWVNYNGITANDLTIAAPEVNLVDDITLGTGALNVADILTTDSVLGFGLSHPLNDIIVDHLNLDGKIYKRTALVDPSFTTLADDVQINTTANTINVQSNAALIQQAVHFADETDGDTETVNVAAGTYEEQVDIDRDLNLVGSGQGVTTILAPIALGASYDGNEAVVYAHDAGTINISGLTIDGDKNGSGNDKFAGLVYKDANGTVDDVHVTNISDDPLSGSQHGNAVLYFNTDSQARTWTIQNSTVDNFQKNGITVKGGGLTANILNNTVTGSGPLGLGLPAQNAIQVSSDALGVIDSNTVSGISYTPRTWASTGVLLYGAADGTQVINNHFTGSGDDIVVYAYDSDDLNISGNTIDGTSWVGVELYDSHNATVYNNTISGAEYGVDIYESNKAVVNQNIITATNTGVSAVDSAKARVKNNTISAVENGVYGDNVSDIHINNNTVSDTTVAGIHVENSNGNSYPGTDIDIWTNTITANGGTGILVQNSKYASIGDHPTNPFENGYSGANTITGADAGIIVEGSDYAWVSHNIVDDIDGDGISVTDSADVSVLKNKVGTIGAANNIKGDGVYAEDADGVLISGNIITETHSTANAKGSGIQVVSSDGADIESNDVSNAGWDGIRVIGGDDVSVDGNTATDSQRAGVYAKDLTNSTVTGNTINGTAQFRGISIAGGNTVEVSGNTIDNTKLDGIIANGVTALTIDNNFIGTNDGNIGDDGIEVKGSAGAQITGNTVNDTAANGIYNNGSNGTTISGNTITNVALDGVLVNPSTGVTVSGNTIDGAYNGVNVVNGGNITVTDNDIFSVTNGIVGTGVATLWIDDNYIDHNQPANEPAGGAYGIYVTGSSNVQIGEGTTSGNEGNTIDDFETGIYVSGNTGTTKIDANDITDVNDGIVADSVAGLTIADNEIDGRTSGGRGLGDGIRVIHSDGAVIGGLYDGNEISNFNGDGIELIDSNNASIAYNAVEDVSGNGVYVDPSNYTSVANNTIDNVGADGVHVYDSHHVTVSGNTIDNTGDDGVEIRKGDNANVTGNYIGTNGGADSIGDNGVEINDSADVEVTSNTIRNTYDHGIYAGLAWDQDILIGWNNIQKAGWDGIHVDGGKNIDIRNNWIEDIQWDGIEVANSNSPNIYYNTIRNVGLEGESEGIQVSNSAWADVNDNWIDGTSGDAIQVSGSNYANIYNNDINVTAPYYTQTQGDGIEVVGSYDVDVYNNTVDDTTANGIYINGSNSAYVAGNTITDAGEHGIKVNPSDYVEIYSNNISSVNWDGINVDRGDYAQIKWNNISDVGADGIDVDDNDYAVIHDNDVYNVGDNGIEVSDSYDAQVTWNDVDETDGHGIFVEDSRSADIEHNEINKHYKGANTLGNGIYVIDSDYVDVKSNDVDDTDQNGIYVSSSDNAEINSNTVTDAGEHGIKVNPSNDVDIYNNNISSVSWDGIYVDRGVRADIWSNTINGTGGDGIDVDDNDNVEIWSNNIVDAGGNGIEVSDSFDADIRYNRIDGVGEDGINLARSTFADIYGNEINRNIWGKTAAGDGIEVKDSWDVDVYNNKVDDTNGNGIYVQDSDSIKVAGNEIDDAGQNGIYVASSDYAEIIGNDIYNVAQNGILVNPSSHVDIKFNDIEKAGWDGIHVDGGRYIYIYDNDIENTGDDGIDVNGEGRRRRRGPSSDYVVIDNNDIYNTNGNGIEVSNSEDVQITWNDIDETDDNGIYVEDSRSADIEHNEINKHYRRADTQGNGIYVENSAYADVKYNDVDDTDQNGIYVSGSDNTEVLGNTVTDAGAHGIKVNPSDDVEISGNVVVNSYDDGIHVDNGDDAKIWGNWIYASGDDGIDVNYNDNVGIWGNHIFGTGDHHGDGNGIEVSGNFFNNDAYIGWNEIYGAGDDGIDVEGNAFATIEYNRINDANDDGIDVEDSAFVDIKNNRISHVGDNGIEVSGSFAANIIGNDVHDVDENGIYVDDSAFTEIRNNNVRRFGDAGIAAFDSYALSIKGNNVFGWNTGDLLDLRGNNGILVVGTGDSLIQDNVVLGMSENGIVLAEAGGTTIDNNVVIGTGQDGIQVNDSIFTNITNNTVLGTGIVTFVEELFGDRYEPRSEMSLMSDQMPQIRRKGSDGDGIHVINSSFTNIDDNLVALTGANGIHLEGGQNALITDNTVLLSMEDGILVEGEGYYGPAYSLTAMRGGPGYSSDHIVIDGNEIALVGGDAIEVGGRGTTEITNNSIFAAGLGFYGLINGYQDILFDLDADEVNDIVTIEGSLGFEWSDGNGIYVHDMYGSTPYYESSVGRTLLAPTPRETVVIADNDIVFTGGNGILVEYASDALIANNDVRFTSVDSTSWDINLSFDEDLLGDIIDTVLPVLSHAFNYIENAPADELGDTIRDIAGFAHDVDDYVNVPQILAAVIPTPDDIASDEYGAGISVYNVGDVSIVENTVTNAGSNGIVIANIDNALVDNNVVTSSGANGFFAAGPYNGSVTLAGNTFTDNEVGARFESGEIDITGEANTFIGGRVAMQFDPAVLRSRRVIGPAPTANLSLVGDTLGTTIFSGQSDYYVELRNGALFNPGTPTIINGLNATFDGIKPSAQGGILTQAQLDAIESKLYDYDDLSSLGQIFVGITPLLNVEDFFRQFLGFSGTPGGLNLRLANLPYTGIGPAINLANIEPAAGGEDEDGNPQDLASIEPAAGGEETTCWGDAVSAVIGGSPASFNFGGTFEDSLAAASSCGSETF